MRRLMAWVVAAVVVAGGGFLVVRVAGADSGARYRVATAAMGDVSQTVSVSGTVDRVNRANLSFGTSGVLASLSVAVGAAVTAGQRLGTLDTASLQAAVDKAAADLSSAKANLTSAEDTVEAAASSSSSSADSTAPLVQEVKDAQSAASAALKAAADAVTAQTAACADPTAPACASAGAATLKAQQAVNAAQEALQGKLNALSAAVSRASSQPSQPAQSSRSGSSANSVADAQAAVDQANVKLVEAQQALAGATLTSPITGTVASVSSAVGDQVSTGTAVVVVVGEGAADVSATVPVEQLSKLAVGQAATVTPVGTTASIPGTVTRVGTLPDPSAQTVAYPVTITIDKPPAALSSGSSATAAVVVATAKNVLTVPTSAVNRGTVTILSGEATTVTPVTVGAVGPTRTEIKQGLSKGDQVVLANLDSPLPAGDQANQGGLLGGPIRGTGGGPVFRGNPGK